MDVKIDFLNGVTPRIQKGQISVSPDVQVPATEANHGPWVEPQTVGGYVGWPPFHAI